MGSIALVLYAYEEKKKTMMRQIATLGARTDKGNRMWGTKILPAYKEPVSFKNFSTFSVSQNGLMKEKFLGEENPTQYSLFCHYPTIYF